MLNRFCRLIGASAVALVLLTGSYDHDATFDTTSPAAYQKSLDAIRGLLTPERKEKMSFSLMVLLTQGMPDEKKKSLIELTPEAAVATNPDQMLGILHRMIGGRTADEVIRMAAEVRLADLEKRRAETAARAKATAATLASEEKSVADGPAFLAKFKITDAKYYWSTTGYREHSVIDFKITKNSRTVVSRIYLKGVLKTPGRVMAWVSGDFNYIIRGGLEPGETKHLSLTPNRRHEGAFDDTKLRGVRNATLTVTLVNANDAKGEPVIVREEILAATRMLLKVQTGMVDLLDRSIERVRKDLAPPS